MVNREAGAAADCRIAQRQSGEIPTYTQGWAGHGGCVPSMEPGPRRHRWRKSYALRHCGPGSGAVCPRWPVVLVFTLSAVHLLDGQILAQPARCGFRRVG
jgi:hypothetical protein